MRLPHSLHWRIALAYTALIFLSLGIVSLYLVGFVRDTYIANLQASLERQAHLVGNRASIVLADPDQGEAELQALIDSLGEVAGARVTLIGTDGSVVADSLRYPIPASFAAWTQRSTRRTLRRRCRRRWDRPAT